MDVTPRYGVCLFYLLLDSYFVFVLWRGVRRVRASAGRSESWLPSTRLFKYHLFRIFTLYFKIVVEYL